MSISVKFHLSVDSANDAFQTDPEDEIAHILKGIVTELELASHTAPLRNDGRIKDLRDSNGNKVGRVAIAITEVED